MYTDLCHIVKHISPISAGDSVRAMLSPTAAVLMRQTFLLHTSYVVSILSHYTYI
jgi:hypothetical protein